uniref:60S ribosomal protein L24 n=1 Tax=Rhabditophanes sp. KR3021 TaxID=114890 RepID=A0AC35TFN4_9BILA
MKNEVCAFSGMKIYPGHGKRVVRADGKVNIYLSKKVVRFAGQKRNPRDVRWTVLYRRKHKKGTHAEEGSQKKRIKRTVQVASRAIGSTSLDAILALRNQTTEFRRAQRDQAVKEAKDQVRKKTDKKSAVPKVDKKAANAAQKPKVAKAPKAAKPQVGGKR